VNAIRTAFETALEKEPGEYRQVRQKSLKQVIVSASASVDMVDVSSEKRFHHLAALSCRHGQVQELTIYIFAGQ